MIKSISYVDIRHQLRHKPVKIRVHLSPNDEALIPYDINNYFESIQINYPIDGSDSEQVDNFKGALAVQIAIMLGVLEDIPNERITVYNYLVSMNVVLLFELHHDEIVKYTDEIFVKFVEACLQINYVQPIGSA